VSDDRVFLCALGVVGVVAVDRVSTPESPRFSYNPKGPKCDTMIFLVLRAYGDSSDIVS
jgi:hypothetical protein